MEIKSLKKSFHCQVMDIIESSDRVEICISDPDAGPPVIPLTDPDAPDPNAPTQSEDSATTTRFAIDCCSFN